MIHIQLLNKKLLTEFINQAEYYTPEFIPITKHRAFSQIQNPSAEEEDILLLLAYQDKELVGYLGVLPDKIWMNDTFEKCGWLSCLWINPAYRGQQIAQLLLNKCFEVWDKRILATEFTTAAKRLYDKMNLFHDLQIKEGVRLYLRSDLSNLLPPRKAIFKKSIFFLKMTDALVNTVLDIRFLFWRTKTSHLHLEYINHLDEEVENFITDKQYQQLFKRDKNDLNWMIQNPWVLSTPVKDFISNKYYFTSSDQSFDFYALKIRNLDNKLVAFMIFSKRNQTLKLPYCYYDKNELKTVIEALYFHLLEWKINTFTTFHNEIVHCLNAHRTPALVKKLIKRHYIISNYFSKPIHQAAVKIQDGDADCGFT